MAVKDQDEVLKVLRETFPQVVADTLPKAFPMLRLLRERGAWKDAGKDSYQFKPILTVATATTLADGGTYDSAQNPVRGEASLPMKTVHVPLKFTGQAMRGLMSGESVSGMGGVAKDMDHAMRALNKKVNSQMLSSDGSTAKDLDGLPAWISDSNTIAGIAQGSNARFQAAINSTSGAITETKLESVLDTLRTRNEGYLDDFVIVTTPAKARTIAGFDSAKKQDSAAAVNQTYLQKFVGDGSADPLVPHAFYDHIPVFGIPGVTSTRVEVFRVGGEDGVKALYNGGAEGFVIHDLRPAEDSFNYKGQVLWLGNLVCENPYLNAGAVTGLDAG